MTGDPDSRAVGWPAPALSSLAFHSLCGVRWVPGWPCPALSPRPTPHLPHPEQTSQGRKRVCEGRLVAVTVMSARPAGRKEAPGPRGEAALWASVSPSVIKAQRGTCDHHDLLWKLPLSSPPSHHPLRAICVFAIAWPPQGPASR